VGRRICRPERCGGGGAEHPSCCGGCVGKALRLLVESHGATRRRIGRPERGGGGEAEHLSRQGLRWLRGALSSAWLRNSTRCRRSCLAQDLFRV
jgi:hypothetical protein